MRVWVYRLNGRLCVCRPMSQAAVARGSPDSELGRGIDQLTEEEFLEWLRQKSVPKDATDVQLVDEASLPAGWSTTPGWQLK